MSEPRILVPVQLRKVLTLSVVGVPSQPRWRVSLVDARELGQSRMVQMGSSHQYELGGIEHEYLVVRKGRVCVVYVREKENKTGYRPF